MKKTQPAGVVLLEPMTPNADGAPLEAIEDAYRNGLGGFRRVAAAIIGQPELARDAVQEAFATAVRQRQAFRGEGSLEGWLWRIVVNTARDQRRLDRRHDDRIETRLEFSQNGTGAVDDVRAVFSLLPERQRLALFLRYYADLDYEAIAQALEVRPGTVGSTLNAARAALRTLLEEVRT